MVAARKDATDRSRVSSKVPRREGGSGAATVYLAYSSKSEMQSATRVTRTSMTNQHSFLSVDSYSGSQAADHTLNTAITQAKISECFENTWKYSTISMPTMSR